MDATEVFDCDEAFGNTKKAADIHTHPTQLHDTIGIIPSQADIAALVEESYDTKTKMIGCRAAPHAPYVHCLEPKKVPTARQAREYGDATDRDDGGSLAGAVKRGGFVDPYFQDNVANDLDSALFDRHTGERVDNPDTDKLIKSSLGLSGRHTRRMIAEMERGAFCDYITDLMAPGDEEFSIACRHELKTRKFLGQEYERHLPERFLDPFALAFQIPSIPMFFPKQRRNCIYQL